MSTQKQVTTQEWVDIKNTLSLVEGTEYTLSNNGLDAVFVVENSSQPDSSFEGIVAMPREKLIITPTSGNGMYVRTIVKRRGSVYVNEV